MITSFTIYHPEQAGTLIHVEASIDQEKAQQIHDATGIGHGVFLLKTMLSKAVSEWVREYESGSQVYKDYNGKIDLREIHYQICRLSATPPNEDLMKCMRKYGIKFLWTTLVEPEEDGDELPWAFEDSLVLDGTVPKRIKKKPAPKLNYAKIESCMLEFANIAGGELATCKEEQARGRLTDYILVVPDTLEEAMRKVRIEVKGRNMDEMLPALGRLAVSRALLEMPDGNSTLYIVAHPADEPDMTYHVLKYIKKSPNAIPEIFMADTPYDPETDPWKNGHGAKPKPEEIIIFYRDLFDRLIPVEK